MCSPDPGLPPDDSLHIHPQLALVVEQFDAIRTNLAMQRQVPVRDTDARMRLAEIERMGLWHPDLISERGRRAASNAVLSSMLMLQRNGADIRSIATGTRGVLLGCHAVCEAYEAASMPGVLKALQGVESCFEESGGSVIPCASTDEIIDACVQLVTALRMQGVPPHHAKPASEAEDDPPREA